MPLFNSQITLRGIGTNSGELLVLLALAFACSLREWSRRCSGRIMSATKPRRLIRTIPANFNSNQIPQGATGHEV